MEPSGADSVTPRTRAWAVATVRAACGSGRLDLDELGDRLDIIYAATSARDVYAAIADLPHPPAPLMLYGDER